MTKLYQNILVLKICYYSANYKRMETSRTNNPTELIRMGSRKFPTRNSSLKYRLHEILRLESGIGYVDCV